MTQSEYISFCGDICTLCPRYIATQKNDEDELTAVAELWLRLGFRDTMVSNDDIRCNGCTSEKKCQYSITTCKHLNGKKNCGECEQYPCKIIALVFKKSEQYAISCRNLCTEEIQEQLFQAFFMKEDILTAIHAARFDESEQEEK